MIANIPVLHTASRFWEWIGNSCLSSYPWWVPASPLRQDSLHHLGTPVSLKCSPRFKTLPKISKPTRQQLWSSLSCGFFLTNMDYLINCGEDHCIGKSGDHPRCELQDSQNGLFPKHSGGPLSPLSALATSIGTTKEWHFATTMPIPKLALPGWKPCEDRREIKVSGGTREQAYVLAVPVCVRFHICFKSVR